MIYYSVWKDIPEVHCFDEERGEPEFDTAFLTRYDTELCEIINSTFSDDTTMRLNMVEYYYDHADINITRRFTAMITQIGFCFEISNPVEEEVEEFMEKIHRSTYFWKLLKLKRRNKKLRVYLIKNDGNIKEEYLRATGWFY